MVWLLEYLNGRHALKCIKITFKVCAIREFSLKLSMIT